VGKSSLLESIVGKEFLPRGKGIVTRRPLEIQLIQLSEEQDDEWFQLDWRRGEKLCESDEVMRAIEAETEKAAGKNKGVTSVPLRLSFHSRRVLDLLLVDLPGLTKIPVGEQPPDIESKVLDIVMPFIKNPNTLILAVSKA
jgi:dynamin 1-like protein